MPDSKDLRNRARDHSTKATQMNDAADKAQHAEEAKKDADTASDNATS